MSPKKVLYERDRVLEAALAVVKRGGLEALTARAVAARLQASVAPVYKAFRSMDALTRAVLEEIVGLMDERTRRPYTEIPFLNIGVGIVEFARDESRLFQALFLSRHEALDLLEGFRQGVLRRMKEDPQLRPLPAASLKRLLDSIWLYTLGLASALLYGWGGDPGTRAIIRSLKDMGGILIFAEVSGLADSDSRESEREWTRLAREKGIALPGESGAAPRKPARKEKK